MADKKPSRDHRQEMTDKLIAQLEQGTAPWQKPWVDGPPQRAFNPTTDKAYRGGNAMWLEMQGRSDPRWMTYKQAADHGWQVKKGEQSVLVEYWKFHDEKKEQGADGKEKTVRVQLDQPRVFRACVFNAEQIEGIPALARSERSWDVNEKAEAILAASGAEIRNDQSDRAFYRTSSDSIHLPNRSQFPTEGHYYATALHELGHWTGHESRLDRTLGGSFGSESYAREELRAEMASYFLGAEVGVSHDPNQHAAYVGEWVKALKEDKNEIFRAARDAEQIANFVLAFDRELKIQREPSQLPAASSRLRNDIEALEGKRAGGARALGKKVGEKAQDMSDEMQM